MNKLNYIGVLFCLLLISCGSSHNQQELDSYFENAISRDNRALTEVIVADIFTPPVASRIYAYPNVAAYEAIRHMDSQYASLSGQLNELLALPMPDESLTYYYPLSATVAFTEVAKELVFNLEKVIEYKEKVLSEVKSIGIDSKIYQSSVDYGLAIAEEIKIWMQQDGYLRRTALPGYSVTDDPSRWRPTPPDYHEAIEPHWNTIRPFVLDSASQFDPGLPTSFSIDEKTQFYKEVIEVYDIGKNLSEEQINIAKFWDCNPNISYTKGHVMYFQQQISPGGHWMHISAQVIDNEEEEPVEAVAAMAQVSITIADAFISCWDQKYTSQLIRPETVINKYIDAEWNPILQTPAFPEHTSGHSVASAAAATALTHMYGESFAFIDSTEIPYGLPPREFASFTEASEEAALSRLYGGIHYKPAIELGLTQGKSISRYIIKRVNFRN